MEANLSETPNLLLVTPTVSRRTFDGIRVGKSVNAATGQIIFLEGAAEGSALGFDPGRMSSHLRLRQLRAARHVILPHRRVCHRLSLMVSS